MEIASEDVIRLMQQFLREHKLFDTLQTLQRESQVTFNAVDSIDALVSDITFGKWDLVLRQTQHLHLPSPVMMDLYEQIALELAEMGEFTVAKELIRSTDPLTIMKENDATRFNLLDRLTNPRAQFDSRAAYNGTSKEQRREEIAKRVKKHVAVVPPSRLLTLLGQALKFQQLSGVLPSELDLFQNAAKRLKVDQVEEKIQTAQGKIKFSKTSCPQTAQFSTDGSMLVTGTKDGFVEAWDFDKCKLKNDLDYQARDEFMMHEDGVSAEAFSRNGDLLATASVDGKVKVWKVSTGQCLRRFEHAHGNSIHSICFSRDGTQLLTSSLDQLIRLHGLKSGQTLKEFHGHDGYVNSAVFSSDASKVISASCDGSIKVWDAKNAACIATFRPPHASPGVEMDVLSVTVVPQHKDQLILCTRSKQLHLINFQGMSKAVFQDPFDTIEPKGDFVACTLSPKGKYLYGLTEKGFVLCFTLENGTMEHAIQVCNGEVYGIVHHPHRNILATYGNDGYVRIWGTVST
ncbi:hypothetical protein THRCLA_02128 [Thraustotheca clavata]|uniref:WD40 repeat-containing protein SMU1 n=1 Tax=Thraustotheca clavata TaxID=74557 RepID=A0A1W0A6D7_9STRA|nr:hypothetical protein THRCLA_02128 [Thraustotheca clavata]